jgi:AAA domain
MFEWENLGRPSEWECLACSGAVSVTVAVQTDESAVAPVESENIGLDLRGLAATPEELEAQQETLDAYVELEKTARLEEEQTNIFPVVRGIDFLKRPVTPVSAYVENLLYAGCISGLVADAKAGKTTLMWGAIRAILRGEKFLGKPTKMGRILYVGEQGEVSFRHQMIERCPKGWYEEILGHPNFFLLLPEDHKFRMNPDLPNSPWMDAGNWEQRYGIWRQAVQQVKPDVFILDTFGQYADMPMGGENDSAMINNRLFALKQLRTLRPTLASIVLHHTTKTKTNKNSLYLMLKDIRGSGGFAGALDHIVMMNRNENAEPKNRRYISTDGRMAEQKKFALDWSTEGEYNVVEDVLENNPQSLILFAVERNPGLMNLSINKMVEALAKQGIAVTRHQVARFKKARREVEKDVAEAMMPKIDRSSV